VGAVQRRGPPVGRDFAAFMKDWTAKLNERGWGAPAWPKEYGGGGLSVKQQFILSEEFAWRRAPRSGGIGHGWAGPTIMVYGTPEQKAEYLPRILSGEDRWCQLFSEPGAGSDLASLQTRAVRDGDDYVVNGQKIWTSGAHSADMGILIARTDPDAPKHRGISYFLRRYEDAGHHGSPAREHAQQPRVQRGLFRRRARAGHAASRRGEPRLVLATTTLDFERSGIATSVAHRLIVQDLVDYARDLGLARHTRAELADRAIEAQVEALVCYRIITMQERGEIPNKESSIAKLFSSELDVRLATTAMHMSGMASPEHRPRHGREPRRQDRAVLHALDHQSHRRRHERDPAQHHRHPRPGHAAGVGSSANSVLPQWRNDSTRRGSTRPAVRMHRGAPRPGAPHRNR
jgi:alkylation response protein AidB-like acyl-CoA dehydrogenase